MIDMDSNLVFLGKTNPDIEGFNCLAKVLSSFSILRLKSNLFSHVELVNVLSRLTAVREYLLFHVR